MSRLATRLEHGFTVIAIVLLTEGPLPLLLSGGVSDGDGSPRLTSSLLIQLVFLAVYAVTAALVAKRWKSIVATLARERLLLLLVMLAGVSAFWSTAPFISVRRAVALGGTALFGVYLGSRYSLKQQLQLLGWAFGLAIGLSLITILVLPAYGIMDGALHAGLWRGIYIHKNTLGNVMGLSAIVFLLLATETQRRRWPVGVGFTISIALLMLASSKGALLMTTIALAFLAVWWISQRSYLAAVPALAASAVLSGYLVATIVANVHASVALADWMEGVSDDYGSSAAATGRASRPLPAAADVRQLTGRSVLWRDVGAAIQRRPVLGYGYKSFWRGVGSPAGELWRTHDWHPTHAHNGVLELWLDLGLVGVVVFGVGFVRSFPRRLLRVTAAGTVERLWPLVFLLYFGLSNVLESNLVNYNKLFFALYVSAVFSLWLPDAERSSTSRRAALA